MENELAMAGGMVRLQVEKCTCRLKESVEKSRNRPTAYIGTTHSSEHITTRRRRPKSLHRSFHYYTMDVLSEFPDAPNVMDSALIQALAAGGQPVARLEVTILDPVVGEDGPGIAFIDDTCPRTVSAPPHASLHAPPVFIPRPRTVSAPPRAPPWVAGPPPPLELDAEDAVAGESGPRLPLESSTDGVQEDGLNQEDTVQENARHGDDEWERKQIEARTKKTIQDIESIVKAMPKDVKFPKKKHYTRNQRKLFNKRKRKNSYERKLAEAAQQEDGKQQDKEEQDDDDEQPDVEKEAQEQAGLQDLVKEDGEKENGEPEDDADENEKQEDV
jgi:hypothetical protein